MDEAKFWGRPETFQKIKVEFLLSISKTMWHIILKLCHIVTLGIFINCIKVPILTMMLMLNVIVLTRYGLIEDGTKWHHKYKWFQEAIDRWQGFENFFLEWSCFCCKGFSQVFLWVELWFGLFCYHRKLRDVFKRYKYEQYNIEWQKSSTIALPTNPPR